MKIPWNHWFSQGGHQLPSRPGPGEVRGVGGGGAGGRGLGLVRLQGVDADAGDVHQGGSGQGGDGWKILGKLGGNLEETWRNWMNLGKNGGFNISSCFKNILNGDVRWWSCSVVKLSIYGQAPWRWLPEEQLVDLNAPDDIHDYTHRNLANNYTHTYYIYM